MNNPNPFVPKGSLLEQQSQHRSRLKIAVTCFLAVGILSLVGLLIQGCKREKPADDSATNSTDTDTNNFNPPMMDTNNSAPLADTNVYAPPAPMTNTMSVPPPMDSGSEYVVVAGDTLGKIAKAHGVSLKALEAANPGVDPRKLKIKQKLTIPEGGKTVGDNSAAPSTSDSGMETYKVKSGDTLTKIAKAHGTSVKAIQAANNLATTKITVGKTLKIPAKNEAAPSTTASAPQVMDTPPPPPLPNATTTSSAAPGPIK